MPSRTGVFRKKGGKGRSIRKLGYRIIDARKVRLTWTKDLEVQTNNSINLNKLDFFSTISFFFDQLCTSKQILRGIAIFLRVLTGFDPIRSVFFLGGKTTLGRFSHSETLLHWHLGLKTWRNHPLETSLVLEFQVVRQTKQHNINTNICSLYIYTIYIIYYIYLIYCLYITFEHHNTLVISQNAPPNGIRWLDGLQSPSRTLNLFAASNFRKVKFTVLGSSVHGIISSDTSRLARRSCDFCC